MGIWLLENVADVLFHCIWMIKKKKNKKKIIGYLQDINKWKVLMSHAKSNGFTYWYEFQGVANNNNNNNN